MAGKQEFSHKQGGKGSGLQGCGEYIMAGLHVGWRAEHKNGAPG